MSSKALLLKITNPLLHDVDLLMWLMIFNFNKNVGNSLENLSGITHITSFTYLHPPRVVNGTKVRYFMKYGPFPDLNGTVVRYSSESYTKSAHSGQITDRTSVSY